MAANPVSPEAALTPVPSAGAPAAVTPEPGTQVAVREYTETEKKSLLQLQDILGQESDRPLAAVIPFPAGVDESGLASVKTVDEAVPLIGNMIKAEKAAGGIKRQFPRTILRQQHIVAFMLCNPFATTTEICSFFGISPTTLNNITKSDTFKSLIGQHRVTLESGVGTDLQSQLKDTLAAAVEVVQKAVVDKQDPDYALEVMDKAASRLGMGAKGGPAVQINNTIVTPEMIAAARAARRALPDAS